MELLDLDGVIEKGVFEIPQLSKGVCMADEAIKGFLERFRACVQAGR
ncbi:hypothetical protein HpBTM53_14830 [Helicobacter pylori]